VFDDGGEFVKKMESLYVVPAQTGIKKWNLKIKMESKTKMESLFVVPPDR
jgi:hypothetical protein